MLERRPDLVAAERRVAAAFNRVGEARTAQIAQHRLTGNVGYIDSDIVELKPDYENPSAGVGAKFVAPIYTGGGLEAQVEIRTSEQKEAVAQYARTALRAIGNVENALAAAQAVAERETLLAAGHRSTIGARSTSRRPPPRGRAGSTQRPAAAAQSLRGRAVDCCECGASNSVSGLHCIWRLGDGSRHFPLPEAGHCWGLLAWGGSPPGAPPAGGNFLCWHKKVTKRSAFESTSDLTEDPNREQLSTVL